MTDKFNLLNPAQYNMWKAHYLISDFTINFFLEVTLMQNAMQFQK